MQKEMTRIRKHFLADQQKMEKLEIILRNRGMSAFEYYPKEDKLIFYSEDFKMDRAVCGYVKYLKTSKRIHPDDRWKLLDFFQGKLRGPVEVRTITPQGMQKRRILDMLAAKDKEELMYVGCVQDVTEQKEQEQVLKEQVRRDSMTQLYNHFWGRELIEQYLQDKNPYDSCGLLVLDVDYFKQVNDTYGHLFGDKVLVALAEVMQRVFGKRDILARVGGDEFVVLVKNIDNKSLLRKVRLLQQQIQDWKFAESDYTMSCSIGVCFLSENVSGYTYDQLFGNADWALYQAKFHGRNRYEFCDNLQRFKEMQKNQSVKDRGQEMKYLNDEIVSTAFGIFDKTSSFDTAIELLLNMIGTCFQLSRITVVNTNLKGNSADRQYQWTSDGTEEVLQQPSSFSKEDFLTLFHSYDEYGTMVLQWDEMDQYSKEGAATLMQGGAKTVLYAAMYCEGSYIGAISYVTCDEKRYWSRKSRSQLGELTKLISAHLAKHLARKGDERVSMTSGDYDSLTGLLVSTRFRETMERMILGGTAKDYAILSFDFENFRHFNQKYGYRSGDRVLKEFCNFMIETLNLGAESYFTRVISDQFLLGMPIVQMEETAEKVCQANEEFVRKQRNYFPESRIRIRSGIYQIEEACEGVSMAVDAANYARRQIMEGSPCSVQIYDERLKQKQKLDDEIIMGMDEAIEKEQFQVYLQPKVSLKDGSVIGAEAQVRWCREDGRILAPGAFIPLYENNGRIVELDLYIFEQVVKFLQKNALLGRKQVPISINISALHALRQDTAESYLEILKKYEVDPGLTEIELLETAVAADYENMRKLFRQFQEYGMKTSLDDFGTGYSMLSMMVDIPVDTVKMDRTLIDCCDDNSRGFYLLQQIVSLIKGLGYEVLCEGVETEAQVELLKRAGCENVQGFLFYKPMPLQEYEALMYGAAE